MIHFNRILFLALGLVLGTSISFGAKPNKLTDQISWELSNDTLRIFGEGTIPDFEFSKSKAWQDKKVWPNVRVIEIGEGITRIGDNAFLQHPEKKLPNENIVSVYLPLSLRYIGVWSFHNLHIDHLILPSRIETIRWKAFENSRPIEGEDWGTVILPASLRDLGSEAFHNRNIQYLDIQGTPEIDITAITTIPTLETVNFNSQPSVIKKSKYSPEPQKSLQRILGWKNVQNFSFYWKERAKDKRPPVDVVIDGYKYHINYGEECARFEGAASSHPLLDSDGYLYIPDVITYEGETFPVTSMAGNLFRGNLALTDIYLPENMKLIPENAFRDCKNLKHITLPKYLNRIGDFAFDGCEKLEYVNIPETTKVLGNAAFDGCLSLESVYIPDGIKRIGDYCFDVCPKLKHITVPNGVELGRDWYRSNY